jgi:hypothetical protein
MFGLSPDHVAEMLDGVGEHLGVASAVMGRLRALHGDADG